MECPALIIAQALQFLTTSSAKTESLPSDFLQPQHLKLFGVLDKYMSFPADGNSPLHLYIAP